ncbi:hypothetical protein LINPERHAP1_LOCUS10139 [Linum perenne]
MAIIDNHRVQHNNLFPFSLWQCCAAFHFTGTDQARGMTVDALSLGAFNFATGF